jgi:predicted MPP superfamily phosphohydrolase
MSNRNIAKRFRIVHLSDLHIEAETGLVLRVPELVKAERPDVIVLTGDYLNRTESQDVLKRFLNKLEAPQGVYAIMGNWDGWFASEKAFAGTSVKVLAGETARVDVHGSVLEISGAGIPGYYERTPASARAYRLFLNHTPDLIPEAALAGFDLYLCGHTHGGQVRLPFYGALITLSKYGKRYEMGYYQEGNMDAYVTRGIGLEPGIITAARFLCPPEIVVIDIVPPM